MRSTTIEATESTRPVRSQMDLDAGKLTARDAIQLFGVSVGGCFVASTGGLLMWLAFPPTNGAMIVLLVFGASVGMLGILLAGIVWRLAVGSWKAYEDRLADWHEVAIDAHVSSHGIERTRTIRQWDLVSDEFPQMLLVALSVHRQVQRGERTPWSVRSLEGARWMGDHRLGDVAAGEAERMRAKLVEIGLIEGAAPRQAGRWTASSFEDVVNRVAEKWK